MEPTGTPLLDRTVEAWTASLAGVAGADAARRALRAAWRGEVEHPADAEGTPKALRAALREQAGRLALPPVRTATLDDDGTEKLLLGLQDGRTVEAVLIPEVRREASRAHMRRALTPGARAPRPRPPRAAGCLSTQVGCGVRCGFCASGLEGLTRNLSAAELVGQALRLRERARTRGLHLATLVLMGMGEPLHNVDAVQAALRDLTSPWGGEWGITHLTISTVGVVEGLERLAREGPAPNVALSLHAPDDATRARIVPLAPKLPPVRELIARASDYARATKRFVTVSYVLLDGVNDDLDRADALVALLRGSGVHHVNLIPWNEVEGLGYAPSPPERAQAFFDRVRAAGIPCHLRRARGASRDAACGQLKRRTSATSEPPPAPRASAVSQTPRASAASEAPRASLTPRASEASEPEAASEASAASVPDAARQVPRTSAAGARETPRASAASEAQPLQAAP